MSRINFHKINSSILALLGITFPLAGCFNVLYGPAEDYEIPNSSHYEAAWLYGLVTAKISGSKVSGIKVSLLLENKEISATTTDSNGNYYFALSSGLLKTKTEYTIRFEDIDGETNGSYASLTDTIILDSLSVSTKKSVCLDYDENDEENGGQKTEFEGSGQ